MSGNLYFNWEGEPAVVVEGEEFDKLTYMPSGSTSWEPADIMLLNG